MKSQDKARPVSISVKLHPEVLRLAKALGEFYDGSDVDHIVSEAVKDAAAGKKFQEWLEQHPNAGRTKEEIAEAKPKPRRQPTAATEAA
jgi:hypothetical protein